MPDIINDVYKKLGIKEEEIYKLREVNPQYQIISFNEKLDTENKLYKKIVSPRRRYKVS